jgi:NAD(P)H-dependent flavin oxidoreductase YrpB (nitropropane dioxygenase family)
MQNQLLDILHIEHPLIQAPMAEAATTDMAVAVSENGGLGSLGCAPWGPDTLHEKIIEMQQRTTKPFNVNFFAHKMQEDDYDMGLLMTHLERSVQPDKLPGHETVIRFHFTDVTENSHWWIVVEGDDIDVCIHDPGKDVDIFFNVELKTMCELWMGEISYRQAKADNLLELVGPAALTRKVENWLKPSIFAGIEPANRIMPGAIQQ